MLVYVRLGTNYTMHPIFKKTSIGAEAIDRTLCVAPMMDWTDRHCRYFHRLIAPHALLFTEMITADAIIHAGTERFCAHDQAEHPLVLQLGGANPEKLAQAVRLAEPFGFDEINLNIGCPSPQVQSGRFGACLMAEPHLVSDCIQAMSEQTQKPVTIKCRLGIDDMDIEKDLDSFVETQIAAGLNILYLHSRKAWLQGLSPKENRDIPPLDYQRAARLAMSYPDIDVILNGGITSYSDMHRIAQHTKQAHHTICFAGMMLGRVAYKYPFRLAECDAQIFSSRPVDRLAIAYKMAAYAEAQMQQGVRLHSITRHMLGLFTGTRAARHWRRCLGETARAKEAHSDMIVKTAELCYNADGADRQVA